MSDLPHYIAGLDTLVPTTNGEMPYINIDNAASTPPFKSVLQAVAEFAPWYASVHRGNGFKSRFSTDCYEHARAVVGHFVGANSEEHVVIFTKNATEALNKLSYRLGLAKKDVVLISHLEHHSNDLPWRTRATVKRIQMTKSGGIDKTHFSALLQKYAERIKLVAITGASNVTGYVPDLDWFASRAHAAGAQILVDGAQLVAHRPINMKNLSRPEHIDYIAFSGHKMYAPFGTGVLVGRRDTFVRGTPEYTGGGTVQMVTKHTVDWALPPDSEEAGSPNVIGAIALAEAIQTLQTIGFETIHKHEASLTRYALRHLASIPGLRLYGDPYPSRSTKRSGVIPFTLQGVPPHLVAAVLGYEWGIGVRSGCFCAHPYVMSLLALDRKAVHGVRHAVLHKRLDRVPGLVRISFGLYNTTSDIDRFITALQAISQGKFGQYQVDITTGAYTPKDYARSGAASSAGAAGRPKTSSKLLTSTSRGRAPSAGPTIPCSSISSIRRAARP